MSAIKEKLGILPIKELAKSTEFEKRAPKKIGCEDYVYSFVQCILNGDISQASWCRELSKVIGEPVSEQALQGKVQFRHEEFSEKLLQAALEHTMKNNVPHACCEILSRFESVKLHDSTCVKMPIGLFDFLPGSRSRGGDNAMARIQLSMDLLKNSYSKVALTSFRNNDQSYALEIAKNASKGELHLFDLGYFQKELLGQLNEKEAYYLCRYFEVCLFTPSPKGAKEDKEDKEDKGKDAKAINVVKHLKKLDRQGVTRWDVQLEMGREERIPLRVVAVKLSQKITQKKIRRSKEKRRQEGRKGHNADYNYLLSWNIYFTNVPSTVLAAKEIFRLYSLRWRIEIVFKAWKSKFDFVKMFAKQQYMLPSRVVIQVNLILMTIILFLTNWYQGLFHLVQQKTGRYLSLLKFSAMVKNDLEHLHDLYENDQERLIDILARQYCYDQRKDRLNFVEILYDKKIS